jgi:ActR/RegA family two-component response regulator
VVYRVRAAWCFQMAAMGSDVGHARRFCQTSCDDCVYFRRVAGLDTNVLVVSVDLRLIERLKAKEWPGMRLRFARSAYEASAAVETFLPAFAVVDRDLIEGGERNLVSSLARDGRVPGMKVILAVRSGVRGNELGATRAVVGVIEKPFGVEEIASVIRSFPVESVQSEATEDFGAGRTGGTQ